MKVQENFSGRRWPRCHTAQRLREHTNLVTRLPKTIDSAGYIVIPRTTLLFRFIFRRESLSHGGGQPGRNLPYIYPPLASMTQIVTPHTTHTLSRIGYPHPWMYLHLSITRQVVSLGPNPRRMVIPSRLLPYLSTTSAVKMMDVQTYVASLHDKRVCRDVCVTL
jgi:hypothetical protein